MSGMVAPMVLGDEIDDEQLKAFVGQTLVPDRRCHNAALMDNWSSYKRASVRS